MPQFNSAIIKLNAWCNLDCSYCYMFNLGDETYKSVPREVPHAVWDLICEEIGDHTDQMKGTFNVVLHGGEPSILPAEKFRYIVSSLRDRCGNRVRISVQTNGYSLKPAFLETCAAYGVSIGMSLDGPKEHNDKFRVNHAGNGSYDKVIATVDRMLADGYGHLFGGFLSVASPEISPDAFWAWLKSLPRHNVNLLWPIDYNHMNPPPEPGRYGSWLLDLFDRWLDEDDPNIRIPLFYDVVTIAMGGRTHKDQMVNDSMDMLVINTDGRYEYPDYFRPKGAEAIATDMRAGSTSFAELAKDETFEALFSLGDHLPKGCETCSVRKLCGGGFLANRLTADGSVKQDLSVKSAMCEDHYIFYRGAIKRLYEHGNFAEAV